jgi:N-acetylneuraminic acid mutarotase
MSRARMWMLAVVLGAACGGGDDDDDGGGDAGGDAGGGGGSWDRLDDLPTGPVQETAVVEMDGLIYVLGGIDDERGAVAQVLVYDPAADQWLADGAPALPLEVHHVNAAVLDGTIYVVGSLAGDFSPIAQVWSWSPGDEAWATDHAAMPDPRGAAAVGVVDGLIVVAGGYAAGGLSSAIVSSYDPAGDSWDDSPPDLAMPREHATAQVVGGVLYVIGGRSNGIIAISADVASYDGTEWAPRAPMPTARGGIASGVVDGKIAVVGGEGNPDAASGVFPQAELYDPVADAWTSLADMPTPRHGMGAAGFEGKLYVPGGADVMAFAAVDTHEVLTP